MLAQFVWFLIIVGGGFAVCSAAWLARRATPEPGNTVSPRVAGTTFVLVVVALLLLGALWRVHAIAKADARVVGQLAHKRGATFTEIANVLTTTGDFVPSLTIAGVIAVCFYLRSRRLTAVVLPLAVLVEVVLQAGFLNAFHDPTIAKVAPGLTIGGSDGIPSGSMARLLSISLLAAALWSAHNAKVARRFAEFGMAVVFIELMTRLYLGRHFLADIVGGLLLGVLLTVFFGWLLHLVENRKAVPGRLPIKKSAGQPELAADRS